MAEDEQLGADEKNPDSMTIRALHVLTRSTPPCDTIEDRPVQKPCAVG
jgi:hypothetical protein